MGKQRLKPSGRCIFCPAHGDLSKEHLWPDWANQYLPGNGPRVMTGLKAQVHMKELPTGTVRTRPGTVKNTRLRIVCTTCNNGWMSKLENEAKPFLVPMMHGQSLMLDAAALGTIRHWATLKIMIAEFHRPEHSVLTDDERSAFREHRQMPIHMSVWLARCTSAEWQARLNMQSADLVLQRFASKYLGGRTIQTTTLGFGQILLHAVVRKPIAPDIDAVVTFRVGMLKLWPSEATSAYWPPSGRQVSESDAEYIAGRLQLELLEPRTQWASVHLARNHGE